MQEIRCPNCGEVFQVDETGYQQIAHQVRDQEFMKELKRREEELQASRKRELELIRLQEERQHDADMAKKTAEIVALERKIADLQACIDAGETDKKLAVARAVEAKNLEISRETKAHSDKLIKKDEELAARTQKIVELQGKLDASETVKKLAVAEAVEKKSAELADKESTITKLKGELAIQETESRLSEKAMK